MIVLVALCYLYVPIQYENIQTTVKYPTTQITSPLINGLLNLIIFSLGPSLFMLIFGFLTIRHVRQTLRRVQIEDVQSQSQLTRRKTVDRQLIRMMLVQCFYFSLLSTPISVLYIYLAVKTNTVTDALQSAKDKLFNSVAGLLSITCACTTFYLFTLSSQLFRRELKFLFKC